MVPSHPNCLVHLCFSEGYTGCIHPVDHKENAGFDANFLEHLPCRPGGGGELPALRPKLPVQIKIAYFTNF